MIFGMWCVQICPNGWWEGNRWSGDPPELKNTGWTGIILRVAALPDKINMIEAKIRMSCVELDDWEEESEGYCKFTREHQWGENIVPTWRGYGTQQWERYETVKKCKTLTIKFDIKILNLQTDCEHDSKKFIYDQRKIWKFLS